MNHLLDKFINESRLRGLAPRTINSLDNTIRRFLKNKVNNEVQLQTLGSADIHEYIENYSEGKSRDHLKSQVWALKKFFQFLLVQGIIKLDPTRKFGHARSSVPKKIPTYLKLSEMKNILDLAANDPEESVLILIIILFVSGLRVSELADLQRSAYSPRKGCIRVKVKGGWIREVPLTDGCIFLLDSYLKDRSDVVPTLLLNSKGKRCSTNWIHKVLKSIGMEIDLEKNLCPNYFRHTFGTYGVQKLGTEMTSCLLGHQLTKTTKVYAHLAPEHFRSIVNKLPLSKEAL